jgi:hypothetical protein
MYKYVLYGLGVHTEIPLWGKGVTDCQADVTVQWRRNPRAAEGCTEDEVMQIERPDHIQLAWSDFGSMTVRSGSEIVVETRDDGEMNMIRHLVNGLGLGIALHQRRFLTIHASAVEIGHSAVAIAGPKGTGKSTLAAALQQRGHRLLTDDVVAIDSPLDGLPLVYPGAANLNLWPDSAAATGHDPADLPRIWSDAPKVVGRPNATSDLRPARLGAVVILSRDGRIALHPRRLQGVEAFTQLISQSHALRWVTDLQCLPWHMEQCRRVLANVPIFEMGRGMSLDSLSDLVRRVEEVVASVEVDSRDTSDERIAAVV